MVFARGTWFLAGCFFALTVLGAAAPSTVRATTDTLADRVSAYYGRDCPRAVATCSTMARRHVWSRIAGQVHRSREDSRVRRAGNRMRVETDRYASAFPDGARFDEPIGPGISARYITWRLDDRVVSLGDARPEFGQGQISVVENPEPPGWNRLRFGLAEHDPSSVGLGWMLGMTFLPVDSVIASARDIRESGSEVVEQHGVCRKFTMSTDYGRVEVWEHARVPGLIVRSVVESGPDDLRDYGDPLWKVLGKRSADRMVTNRVESRLLELTAVRGVPIATRATIRWVTTHRDGKKDDGGTDVTAKYDVDTPVDDAVFTIALPDGIPALRTRWAADVNKRPESDATAYVTKGNELVPLIDERLGTSLSQKVSDVAATGRPSGRAWPLVLASLVITIACVAITALILRRRHGRRST